MSLEAELKANTAALVALTAAIAAMPTGSATGKLATTPQAPAADKPVAPKKEGIDYDRDVKALVVEVGQKKGRDAVLAVLGEFKAENALKVDPKDWPKLIEKLKAKLAETAPLA